jgi:histidine triad (HIT) family protein
MSNCIFCKIVAGQIPSKKVYEDDRVYAFHDIAPAAPTHVLIIPKAHYASMNEVTDFADIAAIHEVAVHIAKELGVADSGYRLINNCGVDGGQVVFHVHYHLLGGEQLGPLNG